MAEHITIRPAGGTWVVRAAGAILGESHNALELIEGGYPPVIYFPRDDIAMAFLEPSGASTQCPWKGEATYFSIEGKSGSLSDSAWSYETPKPGVAAIAGHIAFYPGSVTVEEI